MVGVGTVLTDDPDLTCRIPGYTPVGPVRVVADSHFRTRLTCRLVATAQQAPTWLIASDSADPERRRALEEAGATVITVAAGTLGVDLAQAMAALAERGITRVLVEGGAQMAAAMLRADLVDRIAWFHAPAVMGGDGWPAAQAFGIERLAAMPRFVRASATGAGRGHADRTEESSLMFTGIVTGVGTVRALSPIGHGADMRLVIGHPWTDVVIPIGASIACAGCCLTAVEVGADWFAVDASAETLSKTTLGKWRPGSRLNCSLRHQHQRY